MQNKYGKPRDVIYSEDLHGSTWVDIAESLPEPVRYYCEEIKLRVGAGPYILTGGSGSMKSALALDIGRCLTTGDRIFGAFVVLHRPAKVLFINIDMPVDDIDRRIRYLRGAPNRNFERHDWSDSFSMVKLEMLLRKKPGSFVVVDCWADVCAEEAETRPNDYAGIGDRKTIKAFRRAFEANGCDGLVIDHTGRPAQSKKAKKPATEQYMGSAQKRATFRQGYTVELLDGPGTFDRDEDGEVRKYITVSSLKEGESGSFRPKTIRFKKTNFYDDAGELLGARYEAELSGPDAATGTEPKTTIDADRAKSNKRQELAEKLRAWWPDGDIEYSFTKLRHENHGVPINQLKWVLDDDLNFTVRFDERDKRKSYYEPCRQLADGR